MFLSLRLAINLSKNLIRLHYLDFQEMKQYDKSESKRYPVKTGVLLKTIVYALIILMKVILLQSPLIKEKQVSRHAQTRVFRDLA